MTTAEAERTVRNAELNRWLLSEARRYSLELASLLVISLIGALLLLAIPIPIKITLDHILGSEPLPGYLVAMLPDVTLQNKDVLLLVTAALGVLLALVQYTRGIVEGLLQTHTAQHLVLDLRSALFGHLQRMSLLYHDSKGVADSVYRMHNDATCVEGIIISGLIPLVTSAFTVVAMAIVCLSIDWELTALAISVVPVIFLITRYFRDRLRARWAETKERESSVLTVMQETLASLRVVKAYGKEAQQSARLLDRGARSIDSRLLAVWLEGVFNLAVGTAVALGTAVVLYVGAQHVMAGQLSLGDLSVILIYLAMLYQPIQTIGLKMGALQGAFASASRVLVVLSKDVEVPEPANPLPLPSSRGDIEFRNVAFAYSGRKPSLREVCFKAPSGSVVCIDGATGSGKTTLVSLICRFFDPDQGQIMLDGQDLKRYTVSDLRSQISIVLQETVLFSTTIEENIAYGKSGATRDEIVRAAQRASAHGFIEALPDGYSTEVGERGASLSGGQRQRIGLARAFLRDSPILILDEPTSALDEQTEREVLEAVRDLVAGKTTFLISHRMRVRSICDLRLTLRNGRLVESSPATADPRPFAALETALDDERRNEQL